MFFAQNEVSEVSIPMSEYRGSNIGTWGKMKSPSNAMYEGIQNGSNLYNAYIKGKKVRGYIIKTDVNNPKFDKYQKTK